MLPRAGKFAIVVICAGVCGAAVGGVLASADGPSSTINIASTHRFLRAEYAALLASDANGGTREAAVTRFVSKVSQECPNVGLGSPRDKAAVMVNEGVSSAVVIALAQGEKHADERFVRTVAALNWTDHAVKHAVMVLISGLRTEVSIQEPALCQDLKAWAGSAFRIVPADLVHANSEIARTSESSAVLQGLLARYERPGDLALVHRMRPLVRKVAESVARTVQEGRARLARGLGV
jgi:hypothetical protein